LKLVAWRKKCSDLHRSQPTKQIIVARIYSDHSRSKTRMASNRFWHIVSVVKEQSPPVLQESTSTAQGVSQRVQRLSTRDLRFPQASSVWSLTPYEMVRCASCVDSVCLKLVNGRYRGQGENRTRAR